MMDNGMDLIDMMCSCYETLEDADEDTAQYNFSELFPRLYQHPSP